MKLQLSRLNITDGGLLGDFERVDPFIYLIWLTRYIICGCLPRFSRSFMAVTRWDECKFHIFRNRLRRSKRLTGLELMSEVSCVVHPWCPLLSCRSYRFMIMVYYSSQLIMYLCWSLHGCGWSMILPWRTLLETVGLLTLCRISEIRGSEWLYFGYTRT